MKKNSLQAIVLDWAGTTVDYGSCAPAGVFIEVFRRHGLNITMDQARGPMGMNKRAHIATICTSLKGHHSTDAQIDAMYRDFVPLQLECIAKFSALIPGTLEAQAEFRRRGLKIGTTTGYNGDMIGIVAEQARRDGFIPDTVVCASDVVLGRPAPWMALLAANRMQVYPMAAIVKVGDTIADIDEGLNAGMWTVAVAKSGNELGLDGREVEMLDSAVLKARLARAYERLRDAGAHFVVDTIADVPGILDEINARIARGERP